MNKKNRRKHKIKALNEKVVSQNITYMRQSEINTGLVEQLDDAEKEMRWMINLIQNNYSKITKLDPTEIVRITELQRWCTLALDEIQKAANLPKSMAQLEDAQLLFGSGMSRGKRARSYYRPKEGDELTPIHLLPPIGLLGF